jgi:hypothetical protein
MLLDYSPRQTTRVVTEGLLIESDNRIVEYVRPSILSNLESLQARSERDISLLSVPRRAPGRHEFGAMMRARYVARLSARQTFGDLEMKRYATDFLRCCEAPAVETKPTHPSQSAGK